MFECECDIFDKRQHQDELLQRWIRIRVDYTMTQAIGNDWPIEWPEQEPSNRRIETSSRFHSYDHV